MTAPAIAAGGVLIGRRCNPYGAESGGPKRVLGGLYSGRSARTPDMDLPDNVAEGEWRCENLAEVRCYMECIAHRHRGPIMELCSWHEETVYHGEIVAGTVVQVAETVRARGHFEEIQRRQSGVCPRCLYPPSSETADRVDYGALMKEWEGIGQSLYHLYHSPGGAREWYGPLGKSLRQRREDIGKMFDEAIARKIVHKCPTRLVPVNF